MKRIEVLLFAVLLSTTQSIAQDTPKSSWTVGDEVRYWLQPNSDKSSRWFAPRIIEHVGVVKTFDDKQFVATSRTDTVDTTIAAARVLWIEPLDPPEQEANAVQLYLDGKYAAAVRPLLDAIGNAPPVWRQLWLSTSAAQSAMRSGRHKVSLELISQIDRRPLPPLVESQLPVAWQTQMGDAMAVAAAKERLTDSSSAVRLVAASWLLSSANRTQAIAVLQSLRSDGARPGIAAMANSLLWQTVPPPDVHDALSQWQADLNTLPLVYQTGPKLSLIGKLESSGLEKLAKPLRLSLELTPLHPHLGR